MEIFNRFFSYLTRSAVFLINFTVGNLKSWINILDILYFATKSLTNDNEFYNTHIYIFTKIVTS